MSIRVQVQLRKAAFQLNAEFTAPASGVTAVFGRSGAGKSTLLRSIAGLEQAQGVVRIGDQDWLSARTNVPTHQRRVGYVFQEASLFPHLSVRGNLEYGLQRTPDPVIEFDRVVTQLNLTDLLERDTTTLSGGERQRVAVGRALLASPTLLLMDEPLNSLDIEQRREVMPFLEKLCAEFSLPIIYVSHAPDEVARLADYLVLLDDGKVQAHGLVNDMLTRFDLPLARDNDAGTVLTTTTGAYNANDDLSELRCDDVALQVPGRIETTDSSVRVRVLARDVSIALEAHADTSILNIIPAHIDSINPLDESLMLVAMSTGKQPLLARITRHSVERLELQPGQQVYAQIKSVALLN